MDLMIKSDPIGEWLGRRFLEPLVNRFLVTHYALRAMIRELAPADIEIPCSYLLSRKRHLMAVWTN
jgi:hypothetical protein